MNKTIIEVEKIRSYQTLVKKLGYRTYLDPSYIEYKKELQLGMDKLAPISKETPIRATLTFNLKESIDKPMYLVKLVKTGNTWRKFETREEAESVAKEHHYIEKSELVIKYGSIGDNDNITKPILDYLEESGVIDNDRYIIETNIRKTFGNDKNTIEIELEEVDIKDYIMLDN